jgi:colanic acid/amylovoran biosynthesis protein
VQSLPAGIRNKVTTNHSFHQPQRLIEILDEFDMVIATRMHMAILSLCAGTPVFPIAYEFKTQELFKQLGLEQWVQDIEKLNANSVVDSLASFINELPCIASSLYNKVDEAKKSALSSGLIIKKEYDKLVSL